MGATNDAQEVTDVNVTEVKDSASSAETTDASSEETKKNDALDTTEADKEIAEDLAKSKGSDDSDEEEAKDEESEEESKEEEEETKEEESKDESETEAERVKGAEARKQALQTEIRELVAKRNDARAEYEAEIAKHYRTETTEELIEQGLSEAEAENEKLKQEMQMRDFNTHVADLNGTLNIEALQVMQDFPVFDPDSPMFDEKLAERVKGLYERAAQPVIDKKTNLVIKSNIPPYEFYKAFAETHTESSAKSRVEGEIEGKKAAEQETAAAEIPSNSAPQRTKKQDPFLKGLLTKED